MINRWILAATLFFVFAASASAYIPDYHMVMSRTAETHGRGVYVIEQDVVFRGDLDPLVVKETWWVAGENSLRVTFEGRGPLKGLVQGAYLYDGNQRYWREEGGALQNSRVSDDWAEPFFHFRFSKNIKPRLVALKIAPAESLKERLPQITKKQDVVEYTYPQQTFMRLARSGGVVTYAIGTPTPPESAEANPGLWIEQDQFFVRKIRFPSQALVTAEDYSRHGENLYLPRTRVFSWGANTVQVHVNSVKSLGRVATADALKLSSLDAQKNPAVIVKWPEQTLLRDFYQRFR